MFTGWVDQKAKPILLLSPKIEWIFANHLVILKKVTAYPARYIICFVKRPTLLWNQNFRNKNIKPDINWLRHKKMNKLQTKTILIICTIFCAIPMFCIKNKNPIKPIVKYFDAEKLESLNLDNVNSFWVDDSIKSISEYNNALFENYPGFIKGIRYSGDKKDINVSVFSTQKVAIDAMEALIKNVACIIHKDTSKSLEDLYWYTDCIPNVVFTNKWNTIIEVGYYYQKFEEIKELLYNTAIEISKRVDDLSL